MLTNNVKFSLIRPHSIMIIHFHFQLVIPVMQFFMLIIIDPLLGLKHGDAASESALVQGS